MFATVVLNTKQAGIGNGLTYAVPMGGRLSGAPLHNLQGFLVKAPLRKRHIEGIVVDIQEQKPEGDFDVKEIMEIVGGQRAEPLLTAHQIAVAKWMAEYYVCSLRQALSVWLPGGDWGKLLPERKEFVRVVGTRRAVLLRGKKQQLFLSFLDGKDWMRWEEARGETGCTREVLKRLLERGVVEVRSMFVPSVSKSRADPPQRDVVLSEPCLTPLQTAAYKAIKADKRPTLLFGVTGSGKTEIYAALIRDAIKEGKSAILLLPEILLTENFIERFQMLIDREAIAVVHSRLTLAQRRKEWRLCREGAVKLVIGSRSALFSPLSDLSLIILDEEHEWTYKNEQAPRYHALKVAEHMHRDAGHASRRPPARHAEEPRSMCWVPPQHDVKLVLGSATPSVESWHKAKIGTYQLVELPERYGGAALPSVQIVDLAQVRFGKWYPLSPTLVNAIRTRLTRHEQSVLFLNRRGFATSLLCLDCRYRFEDPVTRLPYTVHRSGSLPHLLSHHTGERLEIPEKCPKCASAKLHEIGAGTQRIEVLLEELFPGARVLRADADTLKTPEKMRLLLQTMKDEKADILLGTQSVVKGLDLPNVTLAAVLLADIGLSLPHFRAGERVFQLLTQLTGRSGRSRPGEVIIQTFRPKALEIELAALHDVRSYLESELKERVQAHYPPDTQMVRFVFTENGEKESRRFVGELKKKYGVSGTRYRVSRSPSVFSGGRVWYVFVRGKDVQKLLKHLPVYQGVVDVDPIECL